MRGLDEKGLRTVIYVGLFPNVLLSLHPDYVMTHRLVPLAADRTHIECTWAFAPESLAPAGFRPRVRDRVLGHHQPAGLARVRVGAARLSSPHAVPGPLSPEEDAVYQFVTMVARGYRGQPVWNQGQAVWNSAVPAPAPAR